MLGEYLEKRKSTLLENKERDQKSLDQTKKTIEETQKFKTLVESENEPPFSEFSPRVISSRAQEKIDELQKKLEVLYEQSEMLISKISETDVELHDLNLAIEELDSLTKKITQ